MSEQSIPAGQDQINLVDDRLRRASEQLGIEFNDRQLLQQALVHSSVLNEQADFDQVFDESNERLEFLGDALLSFITAEFLYERYPDLPEGDLTVYRAALVRTETLAGWARSFQLDRLLYLARGEQSFTNNGVGNRVLAGAFEAVVAAIYLDQGIEAARNFLVELLDRDAQQVLSNQRVANYKGRLQEWIQAHDRTTPVYDVVKESGPAHNRHFIIHVQHRGETLGEGEGMSKRSAEQAAARDALKRLELKEE